MIPHFKDNLTSIYQGDARDMADIPDVSVQCVVTSPPYWGLRLYSELPDLVWGGSADCDHQWGDTIPHPMQRSGKHGPASILTKTAVVQHEIRIKGNQGSFCQECGAWRGSFGLEPTVELYTEHTLEILQEVNRVLRKDGVVFWNIGDSYAGSGGYHTDGQRSDSGFQQKGSGQFKHGQPIPVGGLLKPKDLSLVPFRVAIAAQEAGWWVRSVIIWSKINPMPESVTDRPTTTHEYILMLTKSSQYYWDADAVRVPHLPSAIERAGYAMSPFGDQDTGSGARLTGSLKGDGSSKMIQLHPLGRNINTVWEFSKAGYHGAHFAVFPEKLPEICIKAATPEEGCCSQCGAPWERITRPTPEYEKLLGRSWTPDTDADPELRMEIGFAAHGKVASTTAQYETIGWQPTCSCGAAKMPSLVLDPFVGSGTTLWVAKKLNRRAVGYELSSYYCDMALDRNRQEALGI